jgi:hypothetical protein
MPRASYGYRLHYRTDDGDEYEELLGSADRRIPVVYEVPHRKSRCSTRMVRHSVLPLPPRRSKTCAPWPYTAARRDPLVARTLQVAQTCRDSHERSEVALSSSTDINEIFHFVVRRDAVGPKPFVWEIRHKPTEFVFRGSRQPLANMEEAYRSAIQHSND